MTEKLAQRLFAALNKNKGTYLNDYEVARLSGIHENELEQAKNDLEEILVGGDTSITINGDSSKNRRWKMVVRRAAKNDKPDEEAQIGLF